MLQRLTRRLLFKHHVKCRRKKSVDKTHTIVCQFGYHIIQFYIFKNVYEFKMKIAPHNSFIALKQFFYRMYCKQLNFKFFYKQFINIFK